MGRAGAKIPNWGISSIRLWRSAFSKLGSSRCLRVQFSPPRGGHGWGLPNRGRAQTPGQAHAPRRVIRGWANPGVGRGSAWRRVVPRTPNCHCDGTPGACRGDPVPGGGNSPPGRGGVPWRAASRAHVDTRTRTRRNPAKPRGAAGHMIPRPRAVAVADWTGLMDYSTAPTPRVRNGWGRQGGLMASLRFRHGARRRRAPCARVGGTWGQRITIQSPHLAASQLRSKEPQFRQ